MNVIEANDISRNNRLALIGIGNTASDYYNQNRRQFEAYDCDQNGDFFVVFLIPDFTGWQDKHLRIKFQIQNENEFKEYCIEYNPYEYHKWFLNREETYGLFDLVTYLVKPPFQDCIKELVKEAFRMSYRFQNYGEKIFEE